jgi:hypothetical protein
MHSNVAGFSAAHCGQGCGSGFVRNAQSIIGPKAGCRPSAVEAKLGRAALGTRLACTLSDRGVNARCAARAMPIPIGTGIVCRKVFDATSASADVGGASFIARDEHYNFVRELVVVVVDARCRSVVGRNQDAMIFHGRIALFVDHKVLTLNLSARFFQGRRSRVSIVLQSPAITRDLFE